MIRRLPIAALLLSTGLIAQGASAQEPAPAPAPTGGPANLCRELVAFVKKPEEKKQEAATPASQSTAVSNPSGNSAGQPSAAAGSTQSAGLSGPINSQPKAPASDARTNVADGKATLAEANAAAKGPPAPAPLPPSTKPDEALIARIEAAAEANDQVACRAAARTMRVAGIVMPPPLLALAALDPKFYVGTQP